MTKNGKIALIGFLVLIFQSFTLKTSSIIGVYGVSDSDSSEIQLQINEDQTFTFQDYSNPNKKINTSGTWQTKKGYLVLTSSVYQEPFHNKWKFTQNFSTAKSRKGMTFYTLHKQK